MTEVLDNTNIIPLDQYVEHLIKNEEVTNETNETGEMNETEFFDGEKINDDELEKYGYVLEDDLSFPKATIDPKLIKLQKDVTEFITSVILKHEKEFYQLIQKYFNDKMEYLLGLTCSSIIEMITTTTNKFYNNIYSDIQYKRTTDLSNLILEMCEYTEYGPHILLDKLIRLTLEAHLEINREQLVLNGDDYSLYEKSVLNQTNVYLLSCNLLHLLSKGPDDNGAFEDIPEGMNAFDIVIDKNISR